MIKAIETRYAGCRFRSRLEARWAVAFDHLGIAWEYEPQGFVVEDRLNLVDGKTWGYLPDFWFPRLGVWGEVKGSLNDDETRKLLSAAAYLSSNGGAGCHDDGGHDLVVFGPIPPADRPHASPTRLHLHKGELQQSPWIVRGTHAGGSHLPIATDAGEFDPVAHYTLTCGFLLDARDRSPKLVNAYTAARSARFEHGEQG